MMRCIALLLFIGTGATLGADSNSVSNSAIGPKMDVVWQATTNDWPDKLWIYKVVPQEFSPAVISNLLSLSGFSEKDRTKVPGFIKENDKRALFYGELEGTVKHLSICPTLGLIDYLDPKAEASSQLQKVEGVPNEQETTRLGLKYLRLLGIDISQIARKPGTSELDLHWEKGTITYADQASNKEVVLTNNYGVIFARCIDGIKVHGFGGMDISFGNNARVRSLQLCWRNLVPHRLKDCFSLQEIAEQIRNGRITLHPLGTRATIDIRGVRKLTVTQIMVLYEGNPPDKPMDYVSPYINLQGITDGATGIVGVWFECPILKAN
jgi:hypothetical protein